MRTLTLYTRPGCHLCEQALATIEQSRSRLPDFALKLRDISTDERLHDAYFERIPVVEVDGEELCEHFLDEEALQEALGALPSAERNAEGSGGRGPSSRVHCR